MHLSDNHWLYLRSWGKYWRQSLCRLKELQLVDLLLHWGPGAMVSRLAPWYGGFLGRSSWSWNNALSCSSLFWAFSSLCFLVSLSSWKATFFRRMFCSLARRVRLRRSLSCTTLFGLRTSGDSWVSEFVWSQASVGTEASDSFSATQSCCCCCCKLASQVSSLSSQRWSGNQKHPERKSAPPSLPITAWTQTLPTRTGPVRSERAGRGDVARWGQQGPLTTGEGNEASRPQHSSGHMLGGQQSMDKCAHEKGWAGVHHCEGQ